MLEDESDYLAAAVCRRGHVLDSRIEVYLSQHEQGIVLRVEDWGVERDMRCLYCGAKVLFGCTSCPARIRGELRGVVQYEFQPPDFCDHCGAPHPWLSRQGRIYELMNILDEEDLDPADELAVREQLEPLANPDLDDAEQERRWRRVRELAPTLWEKSGAQRIIKTVVSAAIRARLDRES